MKQQLIAGCIALAACMSAGQASAATYNATDDTIIYESAGNVGRDVPLPPPFGGNTGLIAYTDGPPAGGPFGPGAHGTVSLLNFTTLNSALSSLTPGSYTATLNLYMNFGCGGAPFGVACPGATTPGGPAVMKADVKIQTTPWTEAGAAPWATSQGTGNYGTFTVSNSTAAWYSIDITTLVALWDSLGSTGNGIVLSSEAYSPIRTPGGTTGQLVGILAADSETAGFSPYIDIQLNPVPVPAALPLFATGLGVLGWAARRRRNQAAV
jgi:hypothetical protein